MNENKSSEPNGKGKNKRTMIGILIAIIAGTCFGGWLPGLAVQCSIIGEIFLNSLMMIVVPLVILSIIIGITGLGDIRNIGSIGWRTLVYYMTTTAISVVIGIFLVNIIQPGKGMYPSESHETFRYKIDEKCNHTVKLINGIWDNSAHYKDTYLFILLDQNVRGPIKSISRDSITVKYWEQNHTANVSKYDDTYSNDTYVNEHSNFIKPKIKSTGIGVKITLALANSLQGKEKKGIASTIREVLVGNKESKKEGMIPRNIFNAMAQMDILPLIIFSLLMGSALSIIGEKGRPAIEILSILNDAVMQIVQWIIATAPIGIFGLIAARIGKAGGFSGFLPEIYALSKYCFTILLGLGIHGIIVLPLILLIIGRINPFSYLSGVGTALLNAFSTASSSATLPLTIEAVEKNNGISNRTASFVLPLGATINMDGTALYEAVAAIFIAQAYGIYMDPANLTVIFLTATLAAIGAAGIPEAGLVTLIIVLKAVNLPIEGIGLIIMIDWLLDRFRTTVNVWGDSIGAGVIETIEKKK